MLELTTLQVFVFFLFVVSMIAYAALDGFDLGVGCLHLFARTDHERRIFLNSIGPVWDGNSVWIVICVGVLFAGFPKAFTSLFSGLYLPMMGLLFGFMFRAVAMEFRSKRKGKAWRRTWDFLFFLSSLALTLNLGFIIGNLIEGVPLDDKGHVIKEQLHFFSVYTFSVALLNLFLFSMHGAIYLTMKTEGELQERIQRWVTPLIFGFTLSWSTTTFFTAIHCPHMLAPFLKYPFLFGVVLLAIGSIFSIPFAESRRYYGLAFIASCGSIATLVTLTGIGLYPFVIRSSVLTEEHSLTLFNSSTSHATLLAISIVALIGVPLTFFYLSYLYRVFRGKVHIDETVSY